MRPLVTTAVMHLVGTLSAGLALRAGDTLTAVIAVAATVALLAWFAGLHGTDKESGLPLLSSAAAVGLTLTGRRSLATLLPLVVAQVVGSVLAGLALLALATVETGGTLVWDTPALPWLAAAGVLVGLVTSWAVLAIDGGEHAGWLVVPTVLAGATLNVVLVAAVLPAALVGLATAGLVAWVPALVSAGTVLVGSAAGVYVVALVVPPAE